MNGKHGKLVCKMTLEIINNAKLQNKTFLHR